MVVTRRSPGREYNEIMSKWRKLQLAWRFRRSLWKYRKLIRHRKALLAGGLAGVVTLVVLRSASPRRQWFRIAAIR